MNKEHHRNKPVIKKLKVSSVRNYTLCKLNNKCSSLRQDLDVSNRKEILLHKWRSHLRVSEYHREQKFYIPVFCGLFGRYFLRLERPNYLLVHNKHLSFRKSLKFRKQHIQEGTNLEDPVWALVLLQQVIVIQVKAAFYGSALITRHCFSNLFNTVVLAPVHASVWQAKQGQVHSSS